MVIARFEYRLRADIDVAEWEADVRADGRAGVRGARCVSIDGYASPDGLDLAVVRFESEETLRAWKNHPEHVRAQARGRPEFFDAYKVTVASPIHHSTNHSCAASIGDRTSRPAAATLRFAGTPDLGRSVR